MPWQVWKDSEQWGAPPGGFPLPLSYMRRTGLGVVVLRRYSMRGGPCAASPYPGAPYHNQELVLNAKVRAPNSKWEGGHFNVGHRAKAWSALAECDCGYRFLKGDHRQSMWHRLYDYEGVYGSWYLTLREAPPGAVYLADWMPESWKGADGHSVHAITPGGHAWCIDSRASNCTLPDDSAHRCWCRHGDPRKPETLHVDKSCHTCKAGAGSIAVPGYHGFLHNGHFTAG